MKRLMLSVLSRAGKILRHTPLVHLPGIDKLYARTIHGLGSGDHAKVGQFNVHFDGRDRVIAKYLVAYGGYEQPCIDLLCSYIRPGDVVLDVGANIGLYTLAMSRAAGPTGKVLAVEPDPDNLALLRENVQVNACTNVTIVPAALGTSEGVVLLFQSDENRGALNTHNILHAPPEKAVRVPQRTAQSVFQEHGVVPRVCKIDVEGAEPEVLGGMGDQLPEVLLFEFVPWQLREAGHDPVALLTNLQGRGYRFEIVHPATAKREASSIEGMVARADGQDAHLNVLALRGG